MKILLYTISNFVEGASECINLLLKSLQINNKNHTFDFVVLANKILSNNHHNLQVIIDDNPIYNKYIGFIKYSQLLPKNYNYYIYLDSDILYFGNILNLLSIDKSYAIVKENYKMSHSWFAYKYAPQDHCKLFDNIFGINAGSFSYSDTSLLDMVRKLYLPYIQSDYIENAKLEQSSFNYALCLLSNFNLDQYKHFEDICYLHAKNTLIQNKQLYHFCDINQSMKNKAKNMNILYQNYISKTLI